MLVFREQRERIALAPVLRRLVDEMSSRAGHVPHDTLVGWLIDCGEIEAAVTDAVCVDIDAPHVLVRAFARATRAAADAVAASWRAHRASSPGLPILIDAIG